MTSCQQHFRVWQEFWRFPFQNIPQLHNVAVTQNNFVIIRILPFLSVAYFVHKYLNIVLTGNVHCFGNADKGSLRFADCFRRSVAYNDLPVLYIPFRGKSKLAGKKRQQLLMINNN